MIEYVSSCEEALQKLREDRQLRHRFITRFILMNDLDTWKKLLTELKAEVDSLLELSDLCVDEDCFPQIIAFWNKVHGIKNKGYRTLVLPLAEVLRFDQQWVNVLSPLLQLQASSPSYGRMYVPILAAEHIVLREVDRVARSKSEELPKVLRIQGNGTVKIRIIPDQINLKPLSNTTQVIKGIKAYLRLWETGGKSSIDLSTNLASYLTGSIGIFEISVRKNEYELLCDYLPEFSNVPDNLGTPDQWRWLLVQAATTPSFEELLEKMLGSRSPHPRLWFGSSERERWVLWLWWKSNKTLTGYLQRAVSSSKSVTDFEERVWNTCFDEELDRDLAGERIKLIKDMGMRVAPATFWQKYNALNEPLRKLRSLTGVTHQERREILLIVKALIEEGFPVEEWDCFLRLSFPELYYYLQSYDLGDPVITEYFGMYKRARILDTLTSELHDMVQKIAADEGRFWAFCPRSHVLEQCLRDRSQLVWVDGLGMEWVSLIAGLIHEQKPDVNVAVKVGRACLPSITAANKQEIKEEHEFIRDLDQEAHDYDYSYPDSFLKQIEVITLLSSKLVQKVAQGQRVILTSDHGLSRFALMGAKFDSPPGTQSRKYGRYLEIVGHHYYRLPNDIPVVKDGNYILPRTYGCFPWLGTSKGETHGGATLEEALVPIVVLDPKVSAGFPVSIKLLTPQLAIPRSGKVSIKIEINLNIGSCGLKLVDKQVNGRQLSPKTWQFDITNAEPGTYSADVFSGNQYLGQISFELKSGGIREKDFGLWG